MRYVISLIVLACILYLIIIVLGIVLPANYEVSKTKTFNIPIEEAWNFVAKVENYPSYRDEYFAVREISQRKGHTFEWQAFMADGKLAMYQINDFDQNKHLSYDLIRSSNEMTGSWNFFFFGDSTQTTLEITEASQMNNPIEKVYWYFTNRNSRINREFELIESLESQ